MIKFEDLQKQIEKKSDTLFVYNFWATWCKPCVEELPAFEETRRKYKISKLKIILVNLDAKRNLDSKVIPFVKNKDILSEVILLDAPDYNSWMDKIDEKWSGAIPATLFIYSPNKVRVFFDQELKIENLQKIIDGILK